MPLGISLGARVDQFHTIGINDEATPGPFLGILLDVYLITFEVLQAPVAGSRAKKGSKKGTGEEKDER